MKKRISLLALVLTSTLVANAQTTYNPVLTAAPSMHITPDARAAALGEQGVATSADTYSQYWNPAKYAFASSRAGLGLSYTPWMSRITQDIALMQAVGYYQLDAEQRHTLGASLRYFTLGKVSTWDELGNSLGQVSPNEFALDLSYTMRLSQEFSLAATLRYINTHQELKAENKAASALVADLSAYMNKYVLVGGRESRWTAGLSLRNLGSKITLDDGTSQYLPANLAIGTGILYPFDKDNALSLTLELNKLLVPAYPRSSSFQEDANYREALERYHSGSALSGIFRSFNDSPGGFGEELKEYRWSLGAEYNHKDRFFLRAGYSYYSPDKGSLQGFTAGAGVKLNAFRLDASYFVSTIAQNPLDQTLRFSLGFDLDALAKLF